MAIACTDKNRMVAAHILLANKNVSDNIVKISTEIESLRAQQRRILTQDSKGILDAKITRLEEELEMLSVAVLLKEDFWLPQRTRLIKKLKMRGWDIKQSVELLEGLDDIILNSNTQDLQKILWDMSIWTNELPSQKVAISEVRDSVINKISTDKVLIDRYKYTPSQVEEVDNFLMGKIKQLFWKDDVAASIKQEKLYKELYDNITNPESRKALNNYVAAKTILNPQSSSDLSEAEIKRIISWTQKWTLWDINKVIENIDIKNKSQALQEVEHIVFFYTDELKTPWALDTLRQKLLEIKSWSRTRVRDISIALDQYKSIIEDRQSFIDSVRGEHVFRRLKSMWYRTRWASGRTIRQELLSFMKWQTDSVKIRIVWETGKLEDFFIDSNNRELALRLLWYEDLADLWFDVKAIKRRYKEWVDKDAIDTMLLDSFNKTPEEVAENQRLISEWINEIQPNTSWERLSTRLVSYISNKNPWEINQAVYFDDVPEKLRKLWGQDDLYSAYDNIYRMNSALVSDEGIQVETKISALEDLFLSDSPRNALFIKDSRMERDPRIVSLRQKYQAKHWKPLTIISPSWRLDFNYLIKKVWDKHQLYIWASSESKLREITDIFESMWENITRWDFWVTQQMVDDSYSNRLKSVYGDVQDRYTKDLRKIYGNISPIEARNRLNALANDSDFYVEFIDYDSLRQETSTMTLRQLRSEINSIARSMGMSPIRNLDALSSMSNDSLDRARKLYFEYKYTPVDITIGWESQARNSVTKKMDSISELLWMFGYKGNEGIAWFFWISDFNLKLQERWFVSPFDWARDFMEKARLWIVDSDDNYVRAFIRKYEQTEEFNKLPWTTPREKGYGLLNNIFQNVEQTLKPLTNQRRNITIPSWRWFAFVDNADNLADVRKEIFDFYKNKPQRGIRIAYDTIQETHDRLIDDYFNEVSRAINDWASMFDISQIKNKHIWIIDEFEKNVVLKEFWPFYSSRDRKSMLVGEKYDIMTVYRKDQLVALEENVNRIKQWFQQKVEQTRERVAASWRWDSLDEYWFTTVRTRDGYVTLDLDDAIMAEVDKLVDDMWWASVFSTTNREALQTLNRSQKLELYNYLSASNSLKINADWVLQTYYRKIWRLIQQTDFFRTHKLVNTVEWELPQRIANTPITSTSEELWQIATNDMRTKKVIFDTIIDTMSSSQWSVDMVTNRQSIDDIVNRAVDLSVSNMDWNISASTVQRIKSDYSDMFAVYSELVPVDSRVISQIDARVPSIPEWLDDIVINGNQWPTTIRTQFDQTMDEYLGWPWFNTIEPEIWADGIAIPNQIVDDYAKAFTDTYDEVVDWLKELDDLSIIMSNSLLNNARSLYARWARTQAIAQAHDIFQWRWYSWRAYSSLLMIDAKARVSSSVLNKQAIDNFLWRKQSWLGWDFDMLKRAQDELENWNFMIMDESMFSSINVEKLSVSERIAYDVAQYFRAMRDVFNLSESWATGIWTRASFNKDLYNAHNAFLNIGKKPNITQAETIKEFMRFRNALKNNEFFKLPLLSNATESDFFRNYRNIMRNDSLGNDMLDVDNNALQEFLREFNTIMQSNYSMNEFKTVGNHLFWARVKNWMEWYFWQKMSDLFNVVAFPLSRAVVRFWYNVLTWFMQLASWSTRNNAIKARWVSSQSMNKLNNLMRDNNILWELGDIWDLWPQRIMDDIMSKSWITSSDDWLQIMRKLTKAMYEELAAGKSGRTIDWLLSQGNNVQEFIAARRTKQTAMYRALQENPYRTFATVEEFEDFLRTATPDQRRKTLDYIAWYANKTYNDVMGMWFESIDSTVAVTPAQIVGKMIYGTQSYMAWRWANVMKTFFDNIARVFRANGYLAKNWYSAEAFSNVYQYFRNSREFQDLVNTLYQDIRNVVRMSKFTRTWSEFDETDSLTAEDILDTLSRISVYYQAANVLFKAPFMGIDSAADAAARRKAWEDNARSDTYGLGWFTRWFILNFYRQFRFAELTPRLMQAWLEWWVPWLLEELKDVVFNAADWTLRFVVGWEDLDWAFQSERYSQWFMPPFLWQKNTQNQDLMYMFMRMNDSTWSIMREGNIIWAVMNNIKSNKWYRWFRDMYRASDLLMQNAVSIVSWWTAEDRAIINQKYAWVREIAEAFDEIPSRQFYVDNGVLMPMNNIDIKELSREMMVTDWIGTAWFHKWLQNYLDTGSYVYDGKEYRINNAYESLLNEIDNNQLRWILRQVTGRWPDGKPLSAKDRRRLSATLMDQEVDKLQEHPRYREWKQLSQLGMWAVEFDYIDTGRKWLTIADKENLKFQYVLQTQERLSEINPDWYLSYVIRKVARENSENEHMANFLKRDEDRNKHYFPANVQNTLRDMSDFQRRIDDGDVDGALALFSPLASRYTAFDTAEKTWFITVLTNTLNYIDYTNWLTEAQKLNLQSSLIRSNLRNVQDSFPELLEEWGELFSDAYENFLSTMIDLENKFTDVFRDTEEWKAPAWVRMKALKTTKYDLSKFIDQYRTAAINSKVNTSQNAGRFSYNPITPQQMEVLKITTPPAINATTEWLTLTQLPTVGGWDVNRRIRARKRPKFKLPK